MTKLSKRKSRLQFNIGGFAEIDFIDDNTAHLVMEGVTGDGIADFFSALSWGAVARYVGMSQAPGLAVPPSGRPTSIAGSRPRLTMKSGRTARSPKSRPVSCPNLPPGSSGLNILT